MSSNVYASSAAHSFRPTPQTSSTSATATQTITNTPVLRLRATAPSPQQTQRPRIQWADDVVDNEGLGRKSSKVCCIYHAPHPAGESSSDESSSSSESDSSSDDRSASDDDGAARLSGNRKAKQRKDPTNTHKHNEGEHEQCDNHQQHQKPSKARRKARNAYEEMPRSKKGGSNTMVEVKS